MAGQSGQSKGSDDGFVLQQAKAFLENAAFFPALMILVFIRRRLGFRMLKPIWLTTMGWLMVIFPFVFRDAARPMPFLVSLFGVAMVAIGLYTRYQRWCEICAGVRWHTYSAGVTYLERLPIPPILRRCRRTYRFLDPVLCLIIAVVAWFLSHALGEILFVSAASVLAFENALFERILKRDLDTLDGLVEAEIQSETAKFYDGKQPEQRLRTLEDTAGIPTGVAPDIAKQVELRRAKRAAAPDNLAKDVTEAKP